MEAKRIKLRIALATTLIISNSTAFEKKESHYKTTEFNGYVIELLSSSSNFPNDFISWPVIYCVSLDDIEQIICPDWDLADISILEELTDTLPAGTFQILSFTELGVQDVIRPISHSNDPNTYCESLNNHSYQFTSGNVRAYYRISKVDFQGTYANEYFINSIPRALQRSKLEKIILTDYKNYYSHFEMYTIIR